jgi:hypothetical protein
VLTSLDYLFSNRTVLFIGYGLDELEILEYVILKARQNQPRLTKDRNAILVSSAGRIEFGPNCIVCFRVSSFSLLRRIQLSSSCASSDSGGRSAFASLVRQQGAGATSGSCERVDSKD